MKPASRSGASIRPRLTPRWLAAFTVLTLLLHELHEWAHIVTGRILCGAWGSRDFNVWRLAEGCSGVLPTAMGPVFSFGVMWAGAAILLRNEDRRRRRLALWSIFAALPAARVLTVALGGGDELVVASELLGTVSYGIYAATILVVLAIVAPPLTIAYRAMAPEWRKSWFVGLLVLPVVVDVAIVLVGMNSLLEAGLLAEPELLGSPAIVLLYLAALLVLLGLTWRALTGDAEAGAGRARPGPATR